MAVSEPTIADVSKELDSLHITSLRYHVKINDISGIEQLLSQGANVNEKNDFENTALHVAAAKNVNDSHFQVAELLLKNGANVNAQNGTGQTPLWYLMRTGSRKFVELFLNYNADVSLLDKQNRNLLYAIVLSTQVKNPEFAQRLIDRGLDVNDRRNPEWNPLLLAAYTNVDESHFDVIEVLLKNGADVNARNFRGETPLHLLARKGNFKTVRLLLNFNADVNAIDDKGNTPLFSMIFSKNENYDVMQLLIDHGVNVDHSREDGTTALNFACDSRFYNVRFIKRLLKNGASATPDAKSRYVPVMTVAEKLIVRNGLDMEANKTTWRSIVKYTDFSVMHSSVNILTMNDKPLPEWMWKILVEHLAKLESLDWSVHPGFVSTISSNKEYNDYYTQCKDELLRAKKIKPKDSWLTYFNLLVDDRKKFKNYSGNEKLIEDFEKSVFNKEFPIYGGAMVENFRKGIERRQLYDESCILFCNYLPIFDQTHLVVRDTFDCLLSKKNLLIFCK